MKIRYSVFALAAVAVLLVARVAPASPEVDMKTLKVKVPNKEWEGEYNENLKSWTYEKYVDVKGEDTRKPNRVYIDVLPEDAPKTMKEYAEKLKKKDFQDFSYVYNEITEQKETDGGFLITGKVIDHTDKAAKAEPGFVFVKKLKDTVIRVKSGTLVSEELRKEAIELAKSISF